MCIFVMCIVGMEMTVGSIVLHTAVEKIGATSDPLLTTGHEKERITVCLSALASGEKLKPLLGGKDSPMSLIISNVPLLCSLQMIG